MPCPGDLARIHERAGFLLAMLPEFLAVIRCDHQNRAVEETASSESRPQLAEGAIHRADCQVIQKHPGIPIALELRCAHVITPLRISPPSGSALSRHRAEYSPHRPGNSEGFMAVTQMKPEEEWLALLADPFQSPLHDSRGGFLDHLLLVETPRHRKVRIPHCDHGRRRIAVR